MHATTAAHIEGTKLSMFLQSFQKKKRNKNRKNWQGKKKNGREKTRDLSRQKAH